MRRFVTAGVLVGALLLGGCRGMESERPPIHWNMNMDMQNRFEAQEANPLFVDDAAMRTPPPGTIARGMLREDVAYHTGQTADGTFVEQVPVPVTDALLERGQERYNIYCAMCHGGAGDGQGVIMSGDYGYTPAPSFHDAAVRDRMSADGYVYDVIANGIRTMPSYAQQVPVADRWAIVAYVRALQRSQNADASDVPPDMLSGLESERSADSEGQQLASQ